MHRDFRRDEAAQGHGLLDPQDHVVAGAARIVAQVVVQAQLGDLPGFEQGDGLVRPQGADPAGRRGARIFKIASR
jgi:hypothetical protein